MTSKIPKVYGFIGFIGLMLFLAISINLLLKRMSPAATLLVSSPITGDISSPKDNYSPDPLTIEKIFAPSRDWIATLSAQRLRTIIATGDVIPARSVNFKVVSLKNFLWPYEKTAAVVKDADITFANLETPLFTGCPVTQQGMVFCGDSNNIAGIKNAGIDIVNLANNHAGNYHLEGLGKTLSLLQSAGIEATGTSSALIKDIRGIKFAFLGYNDIGTKEAGINWAEEEIKSDIQEAKKKSDIIIVTYHWGVEYRTQPDDRQKYLGHFTIDSGADLVIGNHPHWIQPIEIYKDKLITYAHGNYVFDQMWSQKTREGVIGKYTFYDNQLIDVQYFPVQIEDYGQPFFLTGEKKQAILDEMKKESLILAENNPPSP